MHGYVEEAPAIRYFNVGTITIPRSFDADRFKLGHADLRRLISGCNSVLRLSAATLKLRRELRKLLEGVSQSSLT